MGGFNTYLAPPETQGMAIRPPDINPLGTLAQMQQLRNAQAQNQLIQQQTQGLDLENQQRQLDLQDQQLMMQYMRQMQGPNGQPGALRIRSPLAPPFPRPRLLPALLR
jgi:hypothetical protein